MSRAVDEPYENEPRLGDSIDQYVLDGYLGRGGMGVVFRARHSLSGRRVALKWLRSDLGDTDVMRKRFIREARALGRIEHPNVVGVLDVGSTDDSVYLVMEALWGESLRDLIDREAPLDPAVAASLLIPAMEGVESAHRAGVVHRDLKPENLFIAKTGRETNTTTRVLDFGVSKLEVKPHEQTPAVLTDQGHMVGTPKYMAPEQVSGEGVDARTDVWALGVILYEMLCGVVPFEAKTYGALILAIATEDPKPPTKYLPDLPSDLDAAVCKALEKDPENRHRSVMAFAKALEPFSQGVIFREPSLRSELPPPPTKHQEAKELGCGVPGEPDELQATHSGPSESAPPKPTTPRRDGKSSALTSSAPPPSQTSHPWRWVTVLIAMAVFGVLGLTFASSSTPPTYQPSEQQTQVVPARPTPMEPVVSMRSETVESASTPPEPPNPTGMDGTAAPDRAGPNPLAAPSMMRTPPRGAPAADSTPSPMVRPTSREPGHRAAAPEPTPSAESVGITGEIRRDEFF